MPKTAKHKKSKKPSKNLLLFTILVILLIILSKANQIKFPFTSNPTQASPSASINQGLLVSPKPTHQALPIPQNYGKSVSVPILYYHYIGLNPNPADKARDALSVAPDKFDEQLAYLTKAGYSTIDLDTLYAGLNGHISLPAKPIILSFDDGYIDFYINAYPILRRYNFRSVAFIPTGLIGTGYYLSWDQIKEMNSSGLVSFEAHSINHPNLVSLSDSDLNLEISQSKKDLSAQIGKPVNFFAYPYGASDERVWQAVKNAGFIGAVGTWVGRIESEGNIVDMPRMKVGGGWSLTDFKTNLGL